VSMTGLLFLVFIVSLIQVLLGGHAWANLVSGTVAVLGYGSLRLLARHGKTGWEEGLVFRLERLLGKLKTGTVMERASSIEVIAPDTLDEEALIFQKQIVEDRIREVRESETVVLCFRISASGARITEVKSEPSLERPGIVNDFSHWYSLHRLPTFTDPLWMYGVLSQLKDGVIIVRIDGQDQLSVKRSIERARRNNAIDGSTIRDIDSEVSFDEASQVLEGISRGSEQALGFSLVIGSNEPLAIDPALFTHEKDASLPVLSVLAARRRPHRAFRLRAVTASDLVPNFHDPIEKGAAILKTKKGFPLYFSPLDERLEALHWLVAGASGSGKSFFTGLVL
ncbi:MAG: hypothetical protein H3C63_18735, partial [Candidatus Omnitrophica bacterium]|nr:hypothetical protein [Candidatus Omnitrophota bacterium]